MLNPYLANELRRAARVFQRQGQPNLAHATRTALGDMTDTRYPDEAEALRLLRLAFGGPIDA